MILNGTSSLGRWFRVCGPEGYFAVTGALLAPAMAWIISIGFLSAEVPAPDGGPPVPVIDMHTHIFNARDLPLAGAINAMAKGWVTQSVAEALKDAFLTLTGLKALLRPLWR